MSQSKKAKPISEMSGELWPTKAAKAAPGVGRNGEMFAKLDADLFLANQLFRAGLSARVLDGVTEPRHRRERIRREILASDISEQRLKGPSGELEETFEQAFLRLYREPLIPPLTEKQAC